MTYDFNQLPVGWQGFARDLIAKGEAQFPGIRFSDISAKAGWLSIDLDHHSVSIGQHWRALKFCEGYSSMSWHICSQCGGQNAAQHSPSILPLCAECHGRICSGSDRNPPARVFPSIKREG